MSAANAFETGLLGLIFTNANLANVGDGTGLRGSNTAGVFWCSLHESNPDETGNQATNETDYTNYGRVSVARDTSNWTVTNNVADNDNEIAFPTGGATGAALTHFGIGSDENGNGNLFLYGALGATFNVANAITPAFAAGDLDITLN